MVTSSNSTNLAVGAINKPVENDSACRVYAHTSSGATQAQNSAWLPLLNASRTLYYQLSGAAASSAATIKLLGYRRIGDKL